MVTTIEDLEAQLREGLDRGVDRDIVTVYGDQLQAVDDPRGELIAIDLEIEHSGATPLLSRRRGELIDNWLGTQRPNGAIRYGFLELDATSADPVEQVRLAFGSKAARFTRSITAVGPPKLLRDTLAAVAEARRPFLSRLTLRQWSEKPEPTLRSSPGLIAATPNLKRLEVDARHLFGSFSHPSVRSMRISGFDALGSLGAPELVELDLAFHCHLATARTSPEKAVFERLGDGMPRLLALDLSRNEPGYLDPHTLGGDTDLFQMLSRIGCRARLETLAIPTPPDAAALASVKGALRGMPALRELRIARGPEALKTTLARAGLTIT